MSSIALQECDITDVWNALGLPLTRVVLNYCPAFDDKVFLCAQAYLRAATGGMRTAIDVEVCQLLAVQCEEEERNTSLIHPQRLFSISIHLPICEILERDHSGYLPPNMCIIPDQEGGNARVVPQKS